MRVRRTTSGICCAAFAAGLSITNPSPASAATLPATLDLVGHGWGHGRGMGQYGALGYATGGWSYTQIVAHYYGGTDLVTVANRTVNVSLSELYGTSSITVSAPSGAQLFLKVGSGASKKIADGTTLNRSTSAQTVTAATTTSPASPADVIVAGPWSTGASRRFAGSITLQASPQPRVVNTLALDEYVEGVVPRESPASWGVHTPAALQAQAVAARSYALAYLASSATICDNTSCQVYGGDPTQYGPDSETFASYSNRAVTSTALRVLDCGHDAACGAPGQVALTEFSSSTGGYTAGGAFPAVVDAGDATPSNTNHDWSTSVATSSVQAAYPSVGHLESIVVTARNGLGALGGRVTKMLLVGSAGRATVTGDDFAWSLGLKSDWFAITNAGGASGGDNGYWVVGSNGGVYNFGAAPNYGSEAGKALKAPVIGMAPTATGLGYWLVAADGGIFTFGDAKFYGSTGNVRLARPVIGMASSHDGRGYWLYASDGGIFTFGDAKFHGSTGNVKLARPIVGMAATPTGLGYWLVAADGGIFTFGDAKFYGSTGNVNLAQPVVGMVPTADGHGYWLVGRDGGIFTFGDARFHGSLPGIGVTDTIVSVAPTADGGGYLMVGQGGTAYAFGDAPYYGDPASSVSGWSATALGIFAHKS